MERDQCSSSEITSPSEGSPNQNLSPSEDSINQSSSSSEVSFNQSSSSDVSHLEAVKQLFSDEIELRSKLKEIKRLLWNIKNSDNDGKMLACLETDSLDQKMKRFDSDESPRKVCYIMSIDKPDESVNLLRDSSGHSVSLLTDNPDGILEVELKNSELTKKQLRKIRKSNDDCKRLERLFPVESVCSSRDSPDDIITSSLRDISGQSIDLESIVCEADLIADQTSTEDDNGDKELSKSNDSNLKRGILKVMKVSDIQKVSKEVAENIAQKYTLW